MTTLITGISGSSFILAGEVTFWPGAPQGPGGTIVEDRVTFSAYCNTPDGKEDEPFDFVIWGNSESKRAVFQMQTGTSIAIANAIPKPRKVKTLDNNGNQLIDRAGKPRTTTGYTFDIRGGWSVIKQSTKTITNGLISGKLAIGFDGNIPVSILLATPESQWPEKIREAANGPENQARLNANENKAFVYGVERYGLAKVQYYSWDLRPRTKPVAAPPPPATAAEPMVDGLTRAAMLANGWTDYQLRTAQNGHFAALALAVPPPPATTAPTAPPPPIDEVWDDAPHPAEVVEAQNII